MINMLEMWALQKSRAANMGQIIQRAITAELQRKGKRELVGFWSGRDAVPDSHSEIMTDVLKESVRTSTKCQYWDGMVIWDDWEKWRSQGRWRWLGELRWILRRDLNIELLKDIPVWRGFIIDSGVKMNKTEYVWIQIDLQYTKIWI